MNRPKEFLKWAVEMFGPIALDRRERACRFVEEAIELAQAEGMPSDTVDKIMRRVYSRPAGRLTKEIGQAHATLELLAESIGCSADAEASREFERVKSIPADEWTKRHSAKVALRHSAAVLSRVRSKDSLMRFLYILALLLIAEPAIADDHYSGTVSNVSDGDTFTMMADGKKVRVRLCGVDSPERGQPGYGQAAGDLSKMIEGKDIRCIQVGGGTPCDGRSKSTNHDRIVAQCFIDTKDIGMEMVCSGTAKSIPRFAGTHYDVCAR